MIRNCVNKRFINYRYFSSSNNIFNNLCINESNFNHNSKYISSIQITMNNPNHFFDSNIFKQSIYEANISMRKGDLSIYKRYNSDNLEDLFNKIKNFVNNEIKL